MVLMPALLVGRAFPGGAGHMFSRQAPANLPQASSIGSGGFRQPKLAHQRWRISKLSRRGDSASNEQLGQPQLIATITLAFLLACPLGSV